MSDRPSIKAIINHARACTRIGHSQLTHKQNEVLKDISSCHTSAPGLILICCFQL